MSNKEDGKDDASSIVHINELELDKECVRLPSDYLKFAHKAEDAKFEVSEAKAALDVVEADLSKEIRGDPEKYGIENVTEKAITAAITSHSKYRAAQRELNNAQHRSGLAQAAVWAMEHKKRALSLLVDLHGMGYFASPRFSRKGKEAVEEMSKRRARRTWKDEDE